MSVLAIVVSAILGGILNRFSGYTNISWLPGRNVYWAILAATLIAGFAVDWLFALALAVSFSLYRIPGWYNSIDMGKNDGTLGGDAAVMYIRTLCALPVFFYANVYMNVWYAPLALIVAAAVAVAAYVVGNYKMDKWLKDPFWFVEIATGAALGAAVGTLVR